MMPSRELIREYLSRTRQPPAIFQPTFGPFRTPSPLQLEQEIAYKHPILLLASDDHSIYKETNRDVEVKYFNQEKSVGRLNPDLLRTWEKLSNSGSESRPTLSRSTSDNSDVVIYPPQENSPHPREFYAVNKVIHSESSEDFFFDSIDDSSSREVEILRTDDDDEVSLFDAQKMAAGEGLAEMDSMDRRRMCWSVDS